MQHASRSIHMRLALGPSMTGNEAWDHVHPDGVVVERRQYEGQIDHLPLPGGEGKALKSGARPQPDIPIYLATLSPKSLQLTGELADGWIGTSFMPEHADVFFKDIERGAQKAGRTLA